MAADAVAQAAAPARRALPACRNACSSVSRRNSISANGSAWPSTPAIASPPPDLARSSGSWPSGSRAKRKLLPGPISGSAVSMARKAALRPALSPSKHRIGSRHAPQQPALVRRQRRAERRDALREAGAGHGDDVDIALDRDDQFALVVRGLAGAVVVEQQRALVEERRSPANSGTWPWRPARSARPPKATTRPRAVGDREHHAVPETVVGHGDPLAVDQQPRVDHLLRVDALGRQAPRAARTSPPARSRAGTRAARRRRCGRSAR